MDLLKGSEILSGDPWTYIPSLATKLLLKSTDNDRRAEMMKGSSMFSRKG
jgi:hypothetical protein